MKTDPQKETNQKACVYSKTAPSKMQNSRKIQPSFEYFPSLHFYLSTQSR